MILLVAFVLFQTLAPASTGETTTFLVTGFVASFLIEVTKGWGRGRGLHLSGATAHVLTLLVALAIVVAVKFYEGTFHSWQDILRSFGVVAVSCLATYHVLVEKLGLDDKTAEAARR